MQFTNAVLNPDEKQPYSDQLNVSIERQVVPEKLALIEQAESRLRGAKRRPVDSVAAQLILGVGIRDLTGGFKCYRREVLERIDLDAITSKGYAFQIETTYRALRAGFRVREVPITFVDRVEGGSKMSRRIVLEAIWKVPALRLRRL